MFASSLIAFVATNVYYHVHLKPINDQKVTHIIQNTVSIYEQSAHQDIDEYLSTLTDLGYQFYPVDQKGNERFFGNPFRLVNLDQTHIERVLDGERSEEHTSELESRFDLVCRLLLAKKKYVRAPTFDAPRA